MVPIWLIILIAISEKVPNRLTEESLRRQFNEERNPC